MATVQIKVSKKLLDQLAIKDEALIEKLIEIGAKQVKIEEALAIFKTGKISLWKAARMAGVPLREMIIHASVHGLKPKVNEEMLEDETR
ncbi:MAG: UPF0175 family protein [Euryarchaeota archaeon]|nr:UPF0175 family protein [Euryarchaeota archaeon]MCS4542167.1 UPF0175 family protein [Euryarchaeota archaeon]